MKIPLILYYKSIFVKIKNKRTKPDTSQQKRKRDVER